MCPKCAPSTMRIAGWHRADEVKGDSAKRQFSFNAAWTRCDTMQSLVRERSHLAKEVDLLVQKQLSCLRLAACTGRSMAVMCH